MTIHRVRQSPGGTDAYGDPVTSTTTTTAIADAFTAPRTTNDIEDTGRQGVIVGMSLYVPYGTDLVHTDQISIDGVLYDIDGEPGEWRHPMTSWEAGTEVAIKRAAG